MATGDGRPDSMAKIESLLITVVVSSFPHEWIRRILEVGCIRKDESCASGNPGEDDVADVESVVQAKIVEAEDGVIGTCIGKYSQVWCSPEIFPLTKWRVNKSKRPKVLSHPGQKHSSGM